MVSLGRQSRPKLTTKVKFPLLSIGKQGGRGDEGESSNESKTYKTPPAGRDRLKLTAILLTRRV